MGGAMGRARFRWTAFGLGLFCGVAPAAAQTPPLPPELAACVCLKQASDFLYADMDAKQRALADVRAQLDEVTSRLEAERPRIDVNNPEAVARFRQKVEQRDALFKRANGPATSEARAAVERYNARVNEFNARCANRPMDPALLSRVQPTLACPPP